MDSSPRKRFSANLRRARERAGLSQAALSRESGVSPSEICRIEANEREPRLSTILRLSRALGVEMTELLRGLR